MVKNCLGWRAAVGLLRQMKTLGVAGTGHQRPNTGGHTLRHWAPETQYRGAHFGAETLCIVVKRAGRWLSGDALAVEMVEIHRFLVVTWARATQQRQAQAKSPLSVQIRRKWPEIEKLGLQWGPNACFLLLLPRDGKCQE